LYFYLLVYATKPLFSQCSVLFDKFDLEDDGTLTFQEWVSLIVRAPLTLPEKVTQEDMWLFLRREEGEESRELGPKEGCIDLADFVACWHCHEIEDKDEVRKSRRRLEEVTVTVYQSSFCISLYTIVLH